MVWGASKSAGCRQRMRGEVIVFRDMTKAIAKAEARAKAKGKNMAIVEMDRDDGREVCIVSEDYTRSDEFEAFCGEIIYVTGQ